MFVILILNTFDRIYKCGKVYKEKNGLFFTVKENVGTYIHNAGGSLNSMIQVKRGLRRNMNMKVNQPLKLESLPLVTIYLRSHRLRMCHNCFNFCDQFSNVYHLISFPQELREHKVGFLIGCKPTVLTTTNARPSDVIRCYAHLSKNIRKWHDVHAMSGVTTFFGQIGGKPNTSELYSVFVNGGEGYDRAVLGNIWSYLHN